MAPALRPAAPRPLPRSSRPPRSSRNAVRSYREVSSDDESSESSRRRVARPQRQPPRSNLQPQFDGYASAELTPDNTDSTSDFVGPDSGTYSERTRKHVPHAKPSTRSKHLISSTRSLRSTNNASPRKRRRVGQDTNEIITAPTNSGVIPPWQSLPYLILFDIFLLASRPLYDIGFVARQPSIQWLLDISRLCRSFYEPAMAALYYSPPLFPASRCHGLLSLLELPQEKLSTNYRCLIKQLDVDVPQLLFYKNGHLGYFDLGKLIELTPQLRYLHLYHREDLVLNTDDDIPTASSRWPYPMDVFNKLESNNIRLRNWDWNSRFLESPQLLELMGEIQIRPVFHSVQELRLLNLSGDENDEDTLQMSQHVLASAFSSLPSLRALYFERCPIVGDTLLSRLPADIQKLSITNCMGVNSDNLGIFLSNEGRSLRELFLSQNRHLNLSFTVNLAKWCPQLTAFGVDLTFYDPRFHDVEPHFENLLVDADIPSWPSTLRSIELNNLRKLNDKMADNFFKSLVQAAPELPDLRCLIIKAILKIGWRDRARFRDKWIRKIERAYLRHSFPPNPNRRSVSKAPKLHSSAEPHGSLKNHEGPREGTSRAGSIDGSHNRASPTTTTRKSTRIATKRVSKLNTDRSSSCTSSSVSDSKSTQSESCVQGMCDLVLVRIDNIRPSEAQFKEADFLDEELSGDEDWDGTDPVQHDGYAW